MAGLSESDYAAVGRLAVAVGAMEWMAYEVARALGVARRSTTERDFKSLSVDRALGKARGQAERSMPPWANVDRSLVLEWIDRAREVVNRRNELFHALILATDAASASLTSLRTREARPFDRQEVVTLAERADVLAWDLGLVVLHGLMHRMSERAHKTEPRLHRPGDTRWTLLGDGGATEAEREAWWEERQRLAPPEWHTWPD